MADPAIFRSRSDRQADWSRFPALDFFCLGQPAVREHNPRRSRPATDRFQIWGLTLDHIQLDPFIQPDPIDEKIRARLLRVVGQVGYVEAAGGGYARFLSKGRAAALHDFETTPDVGDRPLLELVAFDQDLDHRRRVKSGFIPSDELVEFWQRGMQSHITEFTPSSILPKLSQLLSAFDGNSLKEAFTKRLIRTLSVLANRQKHGLHDYHVFSRDGRFSVAVQHQILDRFPIVPDEATDFFSLLHRQLTEHLRQGGVFQGRWGRLTLRATNLVLNHENPERSRQNLTWKPADVIE